MFRKSIFLFIILAMSTFYFTLISFAVENDFTISYISDYVEGKVNDPVGKRTVKAYIFSDNPTFTIESDTVDDFDIIVYCNEHIDGENRGVRNRIVKRTVSVGEEFSLLPDSTYEDGVNDGSIYDFINHCYVLRVFNDTEGGTYEDYYIGIVADNIFQDMYELQEEKIALETEKNKELGPAATSR